MAGGVDVNIGADTRQFEQAVRSGMVDPVDDAQQSLEDYAKAADAAGGDLTDTFHDQQRSTTELKRELDDLNRSIRDQSGPTYRKAADASHEFSRRSAEGFDEIKDSARSNAIEVGASFTGGFDQALGGLQGFVAEFLAGFGPAGVLAGVGAAAVLGTITQAVTDGQQAAEAQKQAVADLASEYIEAGTSGRRSFDSVTTAIESMATSTDGSDVIITLQKAFDAAKRSGADYEQVVQAIASGSPAEIGKARRAVEDLASAHVHQADTSRSAARATVYDNQTQVRANHQLTDALGEAERQARDAGRAQQLAARAGLSDLQLKKGLLAQLEGAYDDAAGSVDDYLNKEKTTLQVGPYLRAQRQKVKALEEYRDALAKSDLSPAAIKFLESQGADTAAAMMRGYRNASPAHKRELNQIWTTAGTENATNYLDAIGKDLSKPIEPPRIKRPVVPAPDDSALASYLRQPATKRVIIEGVTRAGVRLF